MNECRIWTSKLVLFREVSYRLRYSFSGPLLSLAELPLFPRQWIQKTFATAGFEPLSLHFKDSWVTHCAKHSLLWFISLSTLLYLWSMRLQKVILGECGTWTSNLVLFREMPYRLSYSFSGLLPFLQLYELILTTTDYYWLLSSVLEYLPSLTESSTLNVKIGQVTNRRQVNKQNALRWETKTTKTERKIETSVSAGFEPTISGFKVSWFSHKTTCWWLLSVDVEL